MKTLTTFFRNHLPLTIVLGTFFFSMGAIALAQDSDHDPVKVKIVKIVDGDTTTIEKTMSETSVNDFTKQFQNIKGKNVQVMITVKDVNKDKMNSGDKNKSAQSMHFNFNMDSTMANSFAKAFAFSDSTLAKSFTWNDSLFKNIPKNFDFNFDFDDKGEMQKFDFNIDTDKDGKTRIIKNGNGKTIVINGDESNVTISKSENGNIKTQSKSIVINDEKGKGKKKVIVSTSVIVMDMEDKEEGMSKAEKKARKEKQPSGESAKDESNFNFYPNPSDGNFNLELELKGNEPAQIKIYDLEGKEIYSEKMSGNGKVSKTIDLSGKKGTFIVTIKQGKRTTNKRIIIE